MDYLEKKSKLVSLFGKPYQKKIWNQAKTTLLTEENETIKNKTVSLLQKIVLDIDTENQHNTQYQIYYLQNLNASYELIRQRLGKDVADAIQKLKN